MALENVGIRVTNKEHNQTKISDKTWNNSKKNNNNSKTSLPDTKKEVETEEIDLEQSSPKSEPVSQKAEKSWIDESIENITGAVSGAAKTVASTVSTAWDNVTDSVTGAYKTVKSWGSAVMNLGKDSSKKIKKFALGAQDVLIHSTEKANEILERTKATAATVSLGLVEGLGMFGEAIVDAGGIVGTAILSVGTGLVDLGSYVVTGETLGATKTIWDNTKAFVSEKYVSKSFDNFYDNTEIGKSIKENAYGFETIRNISSGIGYTTGMIALTVATAGVGTAPTIAATISSTASVGTGIALATGFSQGAEKAWSEGADIAQGLEYGAVKGILDGVSYYAGGKMAGAVIGNGVSKVSKILTSAARVGFDAVDGGLSGVTDPAAQKIYKDESYAQIFEENGGINSVVTGAVIGASMSSLSEIGDQVKVIKKSKTITKKLADTKAKISKATSKIKTKASSNVGAKVSKFKSILSDNGGYVNLDELQNVVNNRQKINENANLSFSANTPDTSNVFKRMSNQAYYEPEPNSFVVVSDFHGSNWILDKVKDHYMKEYETIFNLGDITDRGTDSVKMLLDYKNLAQKNPDKVVYVPGNHDEFIYGAFRSETAEKRNLYQQNLMHNKGTQTYTDLCKLRESNPIEFNNLLDWLGSQPIQRVHEYNNQKYALAHAFFNYDLYKKNPNFSLSDYMKTGGLLNSNTNTYYSSILWYRKSKPNQYQIDMKNLPPNDYTMVIGHTPNATNLDLGNVKVVCVDGGASTQNQNGTYSTRKFDGGSGPEVTVSYEHNDTSPRANNTPESNAYKNALSNKDHDPKLAIGYANQYGILTGNMEFVRKIKTDIYNGSKGLLNQGYVSNAIDYAKKSEDQGIINSIVKDVHTTIDNTIANKPKLALDYANQYSKATGDIEFVRKIETYIYNGSKSLLNQGYVSNAIDYAKESGNQEIINSIVKDVNTTINNAMNNNPKLALDYANQYSKSTGDISINNKVKTEISNRARNSLKVRNASNAINYASKSGNQEIIDSVIKDMFTTINNGITNNPGLALSYANILDESNRQGIIKLGAPNISNSVKTEIAKVTKRFIDNGDISSAINHANNSKDLHLINETKKYIGKLAYEKVDIDPKTALDYAENVSAELKSDISMKIYEKSYTLLNNGHAHEAMDYAKSSNDDSIIDSLELEANRLASELVNTKPKQALDISESLTKVNANYIKAEVYNHAQNYLLNSDFDKAITYAKESKNQKFINDITAEANKLSNMKVQPVLSQQQLDSLCNFKDSNNNSSWHKLVNKTKEKLRFSSDKINEASLFDSDGHLTTQYYYSKNNIFITSDSKEGVKSLQSFYSNLKDYCSQDSKRSKYLSLIEENGLYLSDTETDSYQKNGAVYLSKKDIQNNSFAVFFHETGHYFDFLSSKFTTGMELVNEAIAKENYVSIENQLKMINSTEKIESEIKEYINNNPSIQNEINESVKKDFNNILEQEPTKYTTEELQEIYNKLLDDKYKHKVFKYTAESGLSPMSDIIDALTNGHYRDRTGQAGHGSKYYHTKFKITTEILANFSSLYLRGQTHLIDEFISKEFRENLEVAYKKIIGLD